MSIEHGDDDNERIPRFANPALDGSRKNEDDEHEEDEHEEDRDTERRAKRRGNGDDEETSTPTFGNPALDKGKDEEDEHEDEEKDEDEAEERGNGGNDETSGLDEKKIEEPKPEEPKGQEEVAGRTIGGLREAFYDQSCPQAEKIAYDTIQKHLKKDPSLAPAVVRLFFHDCFVTVRPSWFLLLLHFFCDHFGYN